MTAVSTESSNQASNEAAWAGIRTIIVPTGITFVERRSPVPYRRRTPLRKHPDGVPLDRPGGRDWFGDRVFVETQDDHKRASFGASVTVHVIVAILLMVVVLMGAERANVVASGSSLMMPALAVVPMPAIERAPVAPTSGRQAVSKGTAQSSVEPLPADDSAQAPVESPSQVTPETGDELRVDGAEGGVEGGVASGVNGGSVKGALDGTDGASSPSPGPSAPVRSLNPPRKIKDVTPVYPKGAVASMARGTVVIEATIGRDGKVQDARILRSVPGLDQPALEAVRQWEYAPTLLNGIPVAVILTVVINFGLQ